MSGNRSGRCQRLLRVAGFFTLAAMVIVPFLRNARFVHAADATGSGDEQSYASPLELLISPDGGRIYVLCNESGEVRILDAATYAQIKSIPVGRQPRGFSLSADGTRLFVANSWDDTVSVIDSRSLEIVATWPVGAEPSAVVEDPTGKRIFVANRISSDIAVLNAQSGAEERRLLAGRGASYLTLSPDGRLIFATHIYPNPPAVSTGLENRTPPESEITVIDARKAEVVERIPLNSIAGVFHIALSADGRLGVAAEFHPKNMIPLAHLEHGGAFAYTLMLFGPAIGAPIEIPLDELDRYASQPFGVAIAPDHSRLYVTLGGSESVLAIDVPRMLRFVHSRPRPASGSFAQDLSASGSYVIARIPVGHNPRGLALSNDGRRLLVANRLDDTLSVIDTKTLSVTKIIALMGPKTVSAVRRGEQLFYSAHYSFQGQISCSSCHIDSTYDGLQWNLEPNGFGRDIVDNKMLEDIKDIAPYKWNGANPNIPTECGPRTEKYFWRSENYDDLQLTDLVMYIRSLPARPNRWRQADGALSPAQERGQAIFDRAQDKFGAPIPLENRCSFCHSGPEGTSRKLFDVGTTKATDHPGPFKAPQLTNIAITGPYLHDGSAQTLEEIWTIYNPKDKHGRTYDLTKDELNDLIEYLRTR